MSANYQRATKILHDAVWEGVPSARMAERLDAADLISPDLPEPSMAGGLPRWVIPGEYGDHDATVLLAASQIILMIEDGDKRGIVSTPSEARGMAYALLAAAGRAESRRES